MVKFIEIRKIVREVLNEKLEGSKRKGYYDAITDLDNKTTPIESLDLDDLEKKIKKHILFNPSSRIVNIKGDNALVQKIIEQNLNLKPKDKDNFNLELTKLNKEYEKISDSIKLNFSRNLSLSNSDKSKLQYLIKNIKDLLYKNSPKSLQNDNVKNWYLLNLFK